MDPGLLEMLRTSVTKVLAGDSSSPLAARLESLGWDEVLADDSVAAFQVLFEIKGDTLAGGDALSGAMTHGMVAATGDAGLADASVLLPTSLHPEDAPVFTFEGIQGVLLAAPRPETPTVVPALDADGTLRLGVTESGLKWTARPLDAIDGDLGWHAASATVDPGSLRWLDPEAARAAWPAAVAGGRWALGAELVSIGRHVVASAVAYAGERRQYGRPIGSFQAVQHRLATAYASLIGAGHVVSEAASTGDEWVALVAKCLAGRAAEQACTQAQQTYGAIGFTWEHEFHRYLRRTYALDWALGDWRRLEREIGERLQATRQVPRVGTL